MREKILIILLLLNVGCMPTRQEIVSQTTRIALQQKMHAQIYTTENFKIFTLKKITNHDKPLRVYIEGDGKAFINKSTPSINPTPTSYFLVNLIAKDKYPNIIYIARPCQYVDEAKCRGIEAQRFWTDERFSREVVASISEVLQNFSDKKIELIGYSGGGEIAKLIAQKNHDIISLRTIAGNLDHEKFSKIHHVSILNKSAPNQDLGRLAHIPQIHFVGEEDKVVPQIISQSYLEKLPQKNCVKIFMVKDASHYKGWESKWPSLLKMKPRCMKSKN